MTISMPILRRYIIFNHFYCMIVCQIFLDDLCFVFFLKRYKSTADSLRLSNLSNRDKVIEKHKSHRGCCDLLNYSKSLNLSLMLLFLCFLKLIRKRLYRYEVKENWVKILRYENSKTQTTDAKRSPRYSMF